MADEMVMKENVRTEVATFAAGCFWHVQLAFDGIKGVTKTIVGYTGGTKSKPTYEDVCTDETGHAEAVLLEFDPKQVSYEELLSAFWTIHDPTQLDGQGLDVGSQYRSAIFYHDEKQKKAAIKSKAKEQAKHKGKISTEIVPFTKFYPAEDYHQRYLEKRGQKTCRI